MSKAKFADNLHFVLSSPDCMNSVYFNLLCVLISKLKWSEKISFLLKQVNSRMFCLRELSIWGQYKHVFFIMLRYAASMCFGLFARVGIFQSMTGGDLRKILNQ